MIVYKKETIKRELDCGFCGIRFKAIRKSRRYCSKLCIQRHFLSRKPKNSKTKKGKYLPCVICTDQVYFHPSQLPVLKVYCRKHKSEKAFRFNCQVCGNLVFTQPSQIKYRNRRTCSHKCHSIIRRKDALERRKGYTKHQLDRLSRYSVEAKEWRKAVFARDNYTCQVCQVRGTYLEADHIKPWAYFPDLRFELSNGRTLCRKCHDKTKIGYKKMRELYETHP